MEEEELRGGPAATSAKCAEHHGNAGKVQSVMMARGLVTKPAARLLQQVRGAG